MRPVIKYRSGYKYQLAEDYQIMLMYHPDKDIKTEYIEFNDIGVLKIKEGYAWDGPSGPTIDTRNFMRGSLVHDALYQLIREDYLPFKFKEFADKELRRICLADGMSRFRAWYVFKGVKDFADKAAMPSSEKQVLIAP
jgi:hypothetical protein